MEREGGAITSKKKIERVINHALNKQVDIALRNAMLVCIGVCLAWIFEIPSRMWFVSDCANQEAGSCLLPRGI